MASGCGNCRGLTSTSSLELHVLHGARHCADVAGVRGLDQNDANVGESICYASLMADRLRRFAGHQLRLPRRRARPSPATLCQALATASPSACELKYRAAPSQYRRSRRAPRRRSHRPQPQPPGVPHHHHQGTQRLRHRGRSRRRAGDHRQHPPALPDHAFLAEESGRSGDARHRRGSSTRWTARPTSCTAFRRSRSRSPARSAAASSTRWSTTRCARRSSPPRAAAARISTTTACGSASSARSRAR